MKQQHPDTPHRERGRTRFVPLVPAIGGLLFVIAGGSFFLFNAIGPSVDLIEVVPRPARWTQLEASPVNYLESTVVLRGWCWEDEGAFWMTERRLQADEPGVPYNSVALDFRQHEPNCLGAPAQWAVGTFRSKGGAIGVIDLRGPLCAEDPTLLLNTGAPDAADTLELDPETGVVPCDEWEVTP